MGHEVTFMAQRGSTCDFAEIITIHANQNIVDQIPDRFDIAHFPLELKGMDRIKIPYLITMHGNINDKRYLDRNTVFVSRSHASSYGSEQYVYNGLDWDDYMKPDLHNQRFYFHFLGNASWRVKNVKGAIKVITSTPSEKLIVMGGVRFNMNMGLRFTLSPRVKFIKRTGGSEKCRLLNQSKGLIFPVIWNEPFGLAIIESLYYGCPVFGTPYGSLPELIHSDIGFLSTKSTEIVSALNNSYDRELCHEYAVENFNSRKMAEAYINKYAEILTGRKLHLSSPQLLSIQEQKFLEWK
ncbi:MAG: glycosyltransferase [Saprospiraceae bacterium]|nr:glycosyltransferase [Saprospiraceae bacterium]